VSALLYTSWFQGIVSPEFHLVVTESSLTYERYTQGQANLLWPLKWLLIGSEIDFSLFTQSNYICSCPGRICRGHDYKEFVATAADNYRIIWRPTQECGRKLAYYSITFYLVSLVVP
jgi:hypothetical protein